MLKQDMQAINEDITMAREILEQLEKIPSHDFLSRLAWTLYQVPKLKVLASGFDSNTDHIHKIITTFVQTDALQDMDATIKTLVKSQEQSERLHKKEVKKLDGFLKSIQNKNTSVVEDAIIDARYQEQEEEVQDWTVREKSDKQQVAKGITKDAKKVVNKENEIPKSARVTRKPTTTADTKAVKPKTLPNATILKLKQDQPQPAITEGTFNSKKSSSSACKQKDEITKPSTVAKKERITEPTPAINSLKPKKPSSGKPAAKPRAPKIAEPASSSSNTSQPRTLSRNTKQKTEKSTAAPKSVAESPKSLKTKASPSIVTKEKSKTRNEAKPVAISVSSKAASSKKSPSTKVEQNPQKNMSKPASTTEDVKTAKLAIMESSGISNKLKLTKPVAKAASTAGHGKATKPKPPLNRSPKSV